MKRSHIISLTATALLVLGLALPARDAVGQQSGRSAEIEDINSTSQKFIAAILARDIRAMDEVWAHEPYATFVGPLSTTVVVGRDGVRKAWEMRFGQFDRVSVSLSKPNIHINGKVAWTVGVEKVELLRKDGKMLSFDTFSTNVLENKDGRWLIVSHQATPIFKDER
jgi:ketosteroid isomerase-like protein